MKGGAADYISTSVMGGAGDYIYTSVMGGAADYIYTSDYIAMIWQDSHQHVSSNSVVCYTLRKICKNYLKNLQKYRRNSYKRL